jgi:hypothetical protein
MTNDVLPAGAPIGVDTARRLLLIWQDPGTRQLIRVGELDQLVDGHFAFRYLPGARQPGFWPLVQFPDVDRLYLSSQLPAFFANRVMSRSRASYGDFRHWIGLEGDGTDTPFEVLIRTGGPRATDTFHVVDDLAWTAEGRVVSRFLASGVRHIDGARDRLLSVREGQELRLRDEPDNRVNARAILIDVRDREPVGYVPDWLVEDVNSLRSAASDFMVVADRISPDAPSHLQLLCRIEATVS